jgi:phosphoribosylaminoimidazole-succinocarboxamide synthase
MEIRGWSLCSGEDGQFKLELGDHFDRNLQLGDDVIWTWDSPNIDGFGVRFSIEDVYDNSNREIIKDYFKNWLNSFVNTIRPILKEN